MRIRINSAYFIICIFILIFFIGSVIKLNFLRQCINYDKYKETNEKEKLSISSVFDGGTFNFIGESEGDWSGVSVAGVGDVNGDGYDDILIGAAFYLNRGKAYLFFGNVSGWSMNIDLSNADASFIAEDLGDDAGWSVAGAGDVNNDSYDDILIGAYRNEEGSFYGGQTYLIFGKANGWSKDSYLSNSNASFIGVDGYSGYSVAGAGDVNGDDYDDILIGAYNYGMSTSDGRAYLFFGKLSGWSMDVNLEDADIIFEHEYDGDQAGRSVTSAGDVNGDGYDDILIGAPQTGLTGSGKGKTHLIFGKESGWVSYLSLTNADVTFIGEFENDFSGWSVAGAGDVNGDDYDDILIGAWGNDEGGNNAGQTYLILGKSSGWSSSVALSNYGASFISYGYGYHSGYSVSSAGDMNGDGYDDFIIGAEHSSEGAWQAGQAYLILGKTSGWVRDFDLQNADDLFYGESENDNLGKSVAAAGDMNGDGLDDILIGAPENDIGGDDAGITYLILADYTPIISIITPEVGLTYKSAPNYSLLISYYNLYQTWYSIYDGSSWSENYYFLGSAGIINSTLWFGLPDRTLTVRFYGNNTIGDIGYKEVIIRKSLPPTLTINTPLNGTIFSENAPSFNLTCIDEDLNCTWYSIYNGTSWSVNYSFSGLTGDINQTLWSGLPDGSLIIRFYLNDTSGNIGFSDSIVIIDRLPPTITINTPLNGTTFSTSAPSFNLTCSDEDLNCIWYSIYNGITWSPKIMLNKFEGTINQSIWNTLSSGSIIIRFYANDTAGNINYTDIQVFKKNQDFESGDTIPGYPSFIVISIVIATATATAIFYLYKKRKIGVKALKLVD